MGTLENENSRTVESEDSEPVHYKLDINEELRIVSYYKYAILFRVFFNITDFAMTALAPACSIILEHWGVAGGL